MEHQRNFAALMSRAESVEERHRDDAVEAAGQFMLAEWKKWQKHSAADHISVQEAARLVMEGAEEIGTQWIEVAMRRFESSQSRQVRRSAFP